jgi:predicted O-methyltransferase YrrM
MKPIYLRNVPPPSETFDHVNLLQFLAGWVRPVRYLELGVRTGESFVEVAPYCTEAIAVDSAPLQFNLPPNAVYHQMLTDDYFKSIEGQSLKFDMVFIDADHTFEQSYIDFLNVKDLVVEDGFVFFHDTYPVKELAIPALCSSVYKTAIAVRENFGHEWEIVTLPFNPGLTIAKKIFNKTGMPWELTPPVI